MLGSDYPFPLGEAHPGQLIESMPQLGSNVKVRSLHAVALCYHITFLPRCIECRAV